MDKINKGKFFFFCSFSTWKSYKLSNKNDSERKKDFARGSLKRGCQQKVKKKRKSFPKILSQKEEKKRRRGKKECRKKEEKKAKSKGDLSFCTIAFTKSFNLPN